MSVPRIRTAEQKMRRLERARRWRAAMTDEERQRRNLIQRDRMRLERAAMSPEERAARRRKYAKPATAAAERLRLKVEVIDGYGGSCACCCETILEFLTIDHIVPLRSSKRNLRSLYLKLRRENFPPGYQVLCFNCNQAKGTKAECPHKRLYMKRSPLFRLLSGGRTA